MRLPTLSEEQKRAVSSICVHDLVPKILTGRAGSGKSTIINTAQQQVQMTVCAMTGRAALHVKGTTMDRLFAYSRRDDKCFNKKFQRKMMDAAADLIVIDEASMLGKAAANFVYDTALEYDKTIILVGDWAQASPVDDGWIFDTNLFREAQVFNLTECHRQHDRMFVDALDQLRRGVQESALYEVFKPCLMGEPTEHHVRLYATNDETDKYNQSRLSALKSDHADVALRAEFTDMRPPQLQDQYPLSDKTIKSNISGSRLFENGYLRLGSRLMVTVNDHERQIVNGDTATLLDVALPLLKYKPHLKGPARAELMAKAEVPEGHAWLSQISNSLDILPSSAPAGLLIELDRGGLVYVPKKTVELRDPAGVYGLCEGFPVDLAWAYTGHKAQGATLDHVWVSMSSIAKMHKDSRHGLAYVMCSRAKTLDGLLIDAWKPDMIVCDPIVKGMVM